MLYRFGKGMKVCLVFSSDVIKIFQQRFEIANFYKEHGYIYICNVLSKDTVQIDTNPNRNGYSDTASWKLSISSLSHYNEVLWKVGDKAVQSISNIHPCLVPFFEENGYVFVTSLEVPLDSKDVPSSKRHEYLMIGDSLDEGPSYPVPKIYLEPFNKSLGTVNSWHAYYKHSVVPMFRGMGWESQQIIEYFRTQAVSLNRMDFGDSPDRNLARKQIIDLAFQKTLHDLENDLI